MAHAAKPLRNVAVLTLGCKLNQADSDSLARRFSEAGCAVTNDPRSADAVVVNSCTVTHVADSKARQMIRRARRLSPEATIVLTGCYVDSAGQALFLDEADIMLGNKAKEQIVDLVFRARTGRPPAPEAAGERPALRGLRTRAFLKIQEGCNDVCAFCIVPRVRGREVSRPLVDLVEEARFHEAAGALEVVLTGTQLGHYGRDKGWETGPRQILEALLQQTSIPRIRVSSLQAQDFTPELLELWGDARLCPHFHVPLQSGSRRTLERMRRRYTPVQFRTAIDLIRRTVGGASITTDVIAGFPGETDHDFEETIELCSEIGFAAVHAFPYSVRRGTSAALMSGQVLGTTRHERVRRLTDVGRRSGHRFRESLIGTSHSVLWEERNEGDWFGLTPNYCRVRAAGPARLPAAIGDVRIKALGGDLLDGAMLQFNGPPALERAS